MLSLEDTRWAHLSPGRLLCLDNRAILGYLEELEATTSWARVMRTAGLNMVSLSEDFGAIDILREYYEGHGGDGR